LQVPTPDVSSIFNVPGLVMNTGVLPTVASTISYDTHPPTLTAHSTPAPTVAQATAADASPSASASAAASADGGLSQGATIGIGVGVGVGAAIVAILLTMALLLRRRKRESQDNNDDMKYEPSRQFESSMSGMTVTPMLASAHADRMSYAKGNVIPVSVTSLHSHSASGDQDSGPYRDDRDDDDYSDGHNLNGSNGLENPRHSDIAWPLTPGVITIPPANYKPQSQVSQPQPQPQQQSNRLSQHYANAPLPALPPSAIAQDHYLPQRALQNNRLSQLTTGSALVSPLTPTPSLGGLTRSNTIDSDAPPPPVPPLLPLLRIPGAPPQQHSQQQPRTSESDDEHQTERTPLASGTTPIPDISPTLRPRSPSHSPVSPISPVSQISRQNTRADRGGGDGAVSAYAPSEKPASLRERLS
jgi:hypothetical protein